MSTNSRIVYVKKQLFQELSSYSLTNEQQQVIEHLIYLRQRQLEAFDKMTMFEVRILCQRLSSQSLDDFDGQTNSFDNSSRATSNNMNHVQQKHQETSDTKHHHETQNYEREKLVKILETYELVFEENENLYQEELLQLFRYESLKQNDQIENLMNCLNNYLAHRTDRSIRKIRHKETIFRARLKHPRHHYPPPSSMMNKMMNIYPNVIIEVPENHHPFTDKELAFLSSAGRPNYIRSNQSFLYRKKRIQRKTQEELMFIIKKYTSYLHEHYSVPLKSLNNKQFSNSLETIFNERYFNDSLSYLDLYRIRHDIKLLHSIKRKLDKEHYIIRVSDKSGVFHIGLQKDYEKKVSLYQEKTKAYVELPSNPLMETFYKVVRLLNELNSKRQITAWQHKKMMPNKEKMEPLRPIVSSIHASTTGISKILDRLIRPLFDQYVQQTTIIDGVDLIRRLQKYVHLGLLKPTTHLCTFDITDLYTMLPQEDSIATIKRFLLNFNYSSHVQGMSIEATEQLARIVLTENVFIYENKYYRQVVGGAMGSPFTLILANIFMWDWEQELVERQRNSNEIYGRYIDDIFLTSNDSIENLQQMLKNANERHPNIKLIYETNSIISFLDVQIEKKHDQLLTSVYHKPAAEPYVVPFKSDHPRHVFASIVRAVRYSSTLKEFNRERRLIKLMLLYNGYPVRYIYRHFQKFSIENSTTSSLILPMIHDDNEYNLLRHRILALSTMSEHARANRIASQVTADTPISSVADPLVRAKLLKFQQKRKSLILHFTYERRFAHYKSQIHRKWKESFHDTPVLHINLIIGPRNNSNLIRELVRRRPYPHKRTVSTAAKKH